MTPDPEFLHWCMGACDGTLTPKEMLRFERRLSDDANARRYYAEFVQLHVMLGGARLPLPLSNLAAGYASQSGAALRHTVSIRRLLALAACVALLLGALVWWQGRQGMLNGPLLSSGGGNPPGSILVTRNGRSWSPSENSISVAPGDTVELKGNSKGAVLFLDAAATRLTLHPGSLCRIVSLSPQKCLQLDRGRIRATVARQPEGAPLLIRTPYADATVLGTIFSLDSRSDQTGLTVERGVVRLTQTDGFAENIKAGQSAVAALGMPVTRVTIPAGIQPVPLRAQQVWIKGPAQWSDTGVISFSFSTRPNDWVLTPGATWDPNGFLTLAYSMERPISYRAVSPYFPVRPGERLTIRGKARTAIGARLTVSYYQRDSGGRCFGYDKVPGSFTSPVADSNADLSPFEFTFTTLDSPELSSIALILYCGHTTNGRPQPGDTLDIAELSVSRN